MRLDTDIDSAFELLAAHGDVTPTCVDVVGVSTRVKGCSALVTAVRSSSRLFTHSKPYGIASYQVHPKRRKSRQT